jgi:signal transduction histidine kinase
MDPVLPEDRALVAPEGWQQTGYDTHYRMHGADGSIRWVHNRSVLLPSEPGKPRRMVGVTEDVTERRRAEQIRGEADERLRRIQQLEDISQFKTTLLNTAAHELATPLTPILFELEALRLGLATRLDEDDRRAFDLLARNMDRLTRLIHDLLDAARLQRGSLALHLGPADAADIVRDVVETFAGEASRGKVDLNIDVPSSLPFTVDAQRFMQVITNLVSNAIKFTPPGGRVIVHAQRRGADVVVSLQDTGIGLTAEQIGRLFQPFAQVHDVAKIKTAGTGLGLYVSRGIVEQHGGHIDVHSDGPGSGSTFEVRMPVTGPESGELAKLASTRLAP